MKKAMVLTGDYWHSRESIEPLARFLFDDEEMLLTEDPEDFLREDFGLLISFKDPIENDQIPTPVWCGEAWTKRLLERISEGMGYIAVHAALTDLPKEHDIVTKLYNAVFVSHPAPCPVTFVPEKNHPLLDGIKEFTYPENDEHYVMDMTSDADILAYTVSENGRQPALWAKEYGKGRVCMFTPAHTEKNLSCAENLAVMKNMVKWCSYRQ